MLAKEKWLWKRKEIGLTNRQVFIISVLLSVMKHGRRFDVFCQPEQKDEADLRGSSPLKSRGIVPTLLWHGGKTRLGISTKSADGSADIRRFIQRRVQLWPPFLFLLQAVCHPFLTWHQLLITFLINPCHFCCHWWCSSSFLPLIKTYGGEGKLPLTHISAYPTKSKYQQSN